MASLTHLCTVTFFFLLTVLLLPPAHIACRMGAPKAGPGVGGVKMEPRLHRFPHFCTAQDFLSCRLSSHASAGNHTGHDGPCVSSAGLTPALCSQAVAVARGPPGWRYSSGREDVAGLCKQQRGQRACPDSERWSRRMFPACPCSLLPRGT